MSFLDGYARRLGVLEYKGLWNASTNSPALSSGVGNRGSYYVVSVAGSTAIDGISEWSQGDWIIFEGNTWQRLNTADSEDVQISKLEAIFTDQKEPTGHVDSTQSSISFNEATRTFSISPVSTSFDIYIRGVKQTISTTLNYTIPNTSGSYFLYIGTDGLLNYQSLFDSSLLNARVYTAFIYWNATAGKAISFGDERHSIAMDYSTWGYLHTTRGTQLQSGAALGYTTAGTGNSNADAQVSVSDAIVRDEDITANIRHSASPSVNFEQILSPIAEIPIFYRSGTLWNRDTATQFPIKAGTNRAQYNQLSGGVWSTVDASANGKFLVSYIFVTTNVKFPVIAILGQAEYTSLAEAQANAAWSNINFGDLPSQEIKLCYILIYETNSAFTNSVKSAIRYATDVRFGVDREVSAVSLNSAHSNLSGLGLDDHTQYHTDARGDVRYYLKSQVDTFLAGKQATGNYITALTGDVTATGPGSVAATLSNTGVSAGTYNLVTVDTKGRVTAGTSGSTSRYTYFNTSSVSTTSNAYAAATGLISTTLQPGFYYFRMSGLMQSAAANTGIGVRIGAGTATLTTAYAKWSIAQAAAGTAQAFVYDQTTATTNVTSASVPVANSNIVVNGEGVFRVFVAGTVQIEIRSETNGTAVTLQPDAAFVIEIM